MASDTDQETGDPLDRLFELSSELVGTAASGYLTRLNPAWEQALGWTREELMASPYMSFVHPDDIAETEAQSLRLSTPDPATLSAFENRYKTREGDYRCIRWTAVSDAGVIYFLAKDVTDDRAAAVDQDQAASLMAAILQSVGDGLYVADSAGDLTFVNPAGVRLLGYESAEELLGRSPHMAFHHSRPDGAPYPIEECPLTTVRFTGRPVHVQDDTFWRKDGAPLSVSYSSSPIDLPGGRGSVVAFRDVTAVHAERERLRAHTVDVVWFERISDAIAEDGLVLWAQPIIDLATGEVVKHELLLRMTAPDGALIAPGLFLPAAEKFRLIDDIDRWVISQACELAAREWPLAVNLSAGSVGRADALVYIERELARTGANPERLTFEVTETAVMHDLQDGRRFADRLIALGCAFSLDDFGTGYASLTYLRQLPVAELKIDLQFVRGMADSEPDQKLVEAIVHLAQSFGKRTVAEGVEDEQTLGLLRNLGVDYAQGYHLGRPAPLTDAMLGPPPPA